MFFINLSKKFLRLLWFAVKGMFRKPHIIRKISVFMVVILILFITTHVFARNTVNVVWAFLLRSIWIPLSVLFLMIRHGEVLERRRLDKFFENINLIAYDGSLPTYIETKKINIYIEQACFKSKVHIEDWQNHENDFVMYYKNKIYKIENPKEDVTMAEIKVIKQDLPTMILWNDNYMVDGRRFAIGEGYMGQEIWDCTNFASGLIAGATRMGKTSILRCIARQAILKSYNMYVLDFKGGGDYTGLENVENYGRIVITDPEEARNFLTTLINDVSDRMKKFNEAGVSNIDEFNARRREWLIPWLIIIDEAAEIFDVKPKDTAQKELYTDIDQSLRTLARKSAAAGVHIVMGFIRPDHKVLDGQIKNNLLWRACGYFADSAASRIVLDNDKATELPHNVKGRFIINDEEVQAYYLPLPEPSNDYEDTTEDGAALP